MVHIDSEVDEVEESAVQTAVVRRKLGRARDFVATAPLRRLRDKTVPFCGLPSQHMHALLQFDVPWQLLHMLAILQWVGGILPHDRVTSVEYFCGPKNVTKAMERKGMKSLGYDIAHSPSQDINSPHGWITGLIWCLRTASGNGFSWLGTVCSSWVCVCRASTRRSFGNPRGDLRSGSVREGNRHAARSATIVAICYARLVMWVLEQPLSSLLLHHPAFVHIERKAAELGMRLIRIETYQGCFGADTLKPTMLASSDLAVQAMVRQHPGQHAFAPSDTCRKGTRDSDGRKTDTGNKDTLKGTQTYTEAFGEAVAQMFLERFMFTHNPGNYNISDADISGSDPWEDAESDEPLEWLKAQAAGLR